MRVYQAKYYTSAAQTKLSNIYDSINAQWRNHTQRKGEGSGQTLTLRTKRPNTLYNVEV